MNYKGHKNGGIVASIISFGFMLFNTSEPAVLVSAPIISFIFALYPDMDIHSTPRNMFIPLGLIVIPALMFTGYIKAAGIVFLLLFYPLTQPHRGFVHSIAGMLLAAYSVHLIAYSFHNFDLDMPYFAIATVIGYSMHLLLDTHFKLI